METLHTFADRQRDNEIDASPERLRALAGSRAIRLRVTIDSLTAGSELRCRVNCVHPDGSPFSSEGIFRDMGDHEIGCWRSARARTSGDVRATATIETIGRVRYSADLVSYDAGENVPDPNRARAGRQQRSAPSGSGS